MNISSREHRNHQTVAYFTMEVGLDPAMPTYSGGLGVLAGDTVRAAADLAIPMVCVTLLHRKGYFRQHLDDQGNQSESPFDWNPGDFLEHMEPRVSVAIEGRPVYIRAWRRFVEGISGYAIPVYFLDTALPENTEWDQALTDHLYGEDEYYRLCQEVVLGLGGVAMIEALRYSKVKAYHMNEGHSAFLALALLEKQIQRKSLPTINEEDIDAVRNRCVFTTHTPVPAGHDQFPMELAQQVLGEEKTNLLASARCCLGHMLNMTYLALFFSRYINGVSHRHEEISQSMFPNYPINSITNGVHALTWTSPSFQQLYDRHIKEWRYDNLYLRYAISIPLNEILEAHAAAKRELLAEIEKRRGIRLSPEVMTIGFARRATTYKRGDLLFFDTQRLQNIALNVGPLQVIYGGKAHPRDEGGKEVIRRIFNTTADLSDTVRIIYMEEYDMALAKCICAGVDIWLNTPQKPREASGTSGMKAALNGVPSLSILDGWWIEGHVEGVTGWSIGDSKDSNYNPSSEIASLYDKLESVILPMFYKNPQAYAKVMRSVIALNGSFFNAQRMMLQYQKNAYIDNS